MDILAKRNTHIERVKGYWVNTVDGLGKESDPGSNPNSNPNSNSNE